MEILGRVLVIGATETIGAKEFKKRLLVVKTEEQYPQSIPVEFTQDKTFVLDKFAVGDLVKVGINLRGSEWQGKYYANINGWKIERAEAEKSSDSFMPDRAQAQEPEDDSSDLPF
jgi:hypothetical protein